MAVKRINKVWCHKRKLYVDEGQRAIDWYGGDDDGSERDE